MAMSQPITKAAIEAAKEEAKRLGVKPICNEEVIKYDRSSLGVTRRLNHYTSYHAIACSLYDKKEYAAETLWEEGAYKRDGNYLFGLPRKAPGIGSFVYLLDCFNYGRACDAFQQRPKVSLKDVSLKDYVCPTGADHPYEIQKKMKLEIIGKMSNEVYILRSNSGIEHRVSGAKFAWAQ